MDGRPVLMEVAGSQGDTALAGVAFGPMVNALVAAALFAIMLLVLRRRRVRASGRAGDTSGPVPAARDDR